MYPVISWRRVLALLLAGIAGAVACVAAQAQEVRSTLAGDAPGAAQDAPAVPYKSLSDEALRAEILRRSQILLTGDVPEVVSAMAELAQASDRYRTLVGSVLGLYRSAQVQLTVDAPELKEIEELRRKHTELLEEARSAGVLLTQSQQALWDAHRSEKRVINGVPWECMSFDAATAAKAQGIRERQWDLLLKMEEIAKSYAEKNHEADIQRVNQHLEQRYLAALGYWENHQARKKRVEELASAAGGDYEHLLGTRPSAAWASLRDRAFRLPADKIPGMDVELPAPVRLQLPPTLPFPDLPEEFRVLWDGEKMYARYKEGLEEAAAADRQLLWLQSHHTLLRCYDVLRSLVAAPWDPSIEAWRRGENLSTALLAGVPRFGQHFTWDMLVGIKDSAVRLGGTAWNGLDAAANDPGGALEKLWEAAKRGPEEWKTLLDANALALPTPGDFGDTEQGRLAYLDALDKYQAKTQDLAEKLKPINERLDQAIETALDAFNVFLLGKGIKGGGKYLLENQALWRESLAKWLDDARTQREAMSRAQHIRDNPSAYSAEAYEAANSYLAAPGVPPQERRERGQTPGQPEAGVGPMGGERGPTRGAQPH